MQNPGAILQLMDLWNRFRANHPKFSPFLAAVYQNGLKEGSIIEINVTTKDGQSLASNLRLSADDMELIKQVRGLFGNP